MLLTTQFLGTDGRGEVVIITSTIIIIMLLNGLVGSSAVVYLTPKRNFYQLLIPSYLWALFCSVLMFFLLTFYSDTLIQNKLLYGEIHQPIRPEFVLDVVILGFFGSLFEINALVLLGKEKITTHNLLGLGRAFLIFVILSYYFFGNQADIIFFVQTLHIVYFSIFIISCFILFSFDEKILKKDFFISAKDMLNYGFQDQVSTILHFLNYRITVYALFFIYGQSKTGIFSIALFLMEGVLLISNSISLVQFSKIVNSKDSKYNEKITLDLSKLTFILVLTCCLILATIPSTLYEWMVGKNFTGINHYFALLIPGILAFSSTQVINHYFCSIGKFYHNIISNAIGMTISLIGCFIIIPKYGIDGACITISVTYMLVGTYLVIKYTSTTQIQLKDFLSIPRFNLK